MIIGILTDDIVEKAVNVIAQYDVHNLCIKNGVITLESDNVVKLSQLLFEDHGLCLIATGDGYRLASVIDEGIIGSVASAVTGAAKGVAGLAGDAVKKVADALQPSDIKDAQQDAKESEKQKQDPEDIEAKNMVKNKLQKAMVALQQAGIDVEKAPDDIKKKLAELVSPL